MPDSAFALLPRQILVRRFAHRLARQVLPVESHDDSAALPAAAAAAADGAGLVVVMNHFSRRDPLQIFALLFGVPIIGRRPFMAPVAFHQQSKTVQLVANLVGVTLRPVVTGDSVAQLGRQVRRGAGLDNYLQQASLLLRRGGVVLLAPQGGRRERLGPPRRGRPVTRLVAAAHRAGAAVTLLPVGLELPGEMEYARDSCGGLNFFRRYRVCWGTPLLPDALTGTGNLDALTFAMLAPLVGAPYRRPDGRRHPTSG